MTEHCTPDQIFESSPRSFGVGSKIGYHHHQPCRPTFSLDARGNLPALARGGTQKVGTRLASNFRKGGATLGMDQDGTTTIGFQPSAFRWPALT